MGLLARAMPTTPVAEICNVRDHGAVGDGETLDTGAILACLAQRREQETAAAAVSTRNAPAHYCRAHSEST